MGKDGGFMTPKAIANRIKAKGLQKLRWYCQMCEKQCRDENGFKCHCASEAHQRQMSLFAENSGRYVSSFSGQFKSEFIKILRISHGTKRVHANVVYQEYIADRNHVHMNSTAWNSLNGFVRTLASEGTIILEETEKGPFITWVDKSPETLARQEAIARKERMEKSEDERNAKLLEEQIEKAKETAGGAESEYTELQKKEGEEPLKLKLEFKVPIKMSSSSTASATPTVDTPTASAIDSSCTAADPSAVASAPSAPPSEAAPAKPVSAPKTTSASSFAPIKKPAFSFGGGNGAATTPGGALKKPSWMSSSKGSDKDGAKASAGEPPKKLSAMQQIMEEEKRKRARLDAGGFPPSKRFK